MALLDLLNHRRAVRIYQDKPIDPLVVKACLAQAALAPTSSNMQLWEAYHVTDKDTIAQLSIACLGQTELTTANQVVVFVTRPDLYKERAQQVLDAELNNIYSHTPSAKQEKYANLITKYYAKLIPFLYAYCFGLLGGLRVVLTQCAGLFRPIIRQVSERDIACVLHKSCMLVAQTFMLAMAEQSYDTCPIEGMDTLRVKSILDIPQNAEVSLIVSCGLREEQGVRGQRVRLPFEQTHYRLIS